MMELAHPVEADAHAAAREYLRDKGYSDIEPYSVVRIEGLSVWYFYYLLPEGRLELEVEWSGGRWSWIAMFIYDPPTTSGRGVRS